MNEYHTDLFNKNLNDPSIIRSRIRRSIASIGGGGSIRPLNFISIKGIL
jgi:hypothetical protein